MYTYNRIQKGTLLFLGLLIAVYVFAEVWFVTAFINSATLNENLDEIKQYGDYAVLLAAISFTVNFLALGVRKYQDIKDKLADWLFIAACFFAVYFVINGLINSYNIVANLIAASIIIVIPLFLKRLKESRNLYVSFASLYLVCATFFTSFAFISNFKYSIYASDSDDNVLCYTASEFYKNEFYTPWDNESRFQKIEDYQIESLTFSILTCNSDERRGQIAKDERFKDHLYKRYQKRMKLDALAERYSDIKEDIPLGFAIHEAYRKRPSESTIAYIANEMLKQGYTVTKIVYLLDMIGIEVDIPFNARKKNKISLGYGDVRVASGLSDDKKVFNYAMKRFLEIPNYESGVDIKIPFMASEEVFKQSIVEQTFNSKYAAFQRYNDFRYLKVSSFFSDARENYIVGAPKGLVLNLSVITVILSLFSLLFLLVEVIVGKQQKWSIVISPISLTIVTLLCTSVLLPAPFKDPSGAPSKSTSIIKVHYYTYPVLKTAYIKVGLNPWFNTYFYKPNLDMLEVHLKKSMDKRHYLTPINSSAIRKIQLAYFIASAYDIDKDYDAELSKIEAFYNKIGDEKKREYVSEIKEIYY